jgi:hypothetical protein
MLRGFIQDLKRFRIVDQRAILTAAKVPVIHENDFSEALSSLRAGDLLAVPRLRALGNDYKQIAERVKKTHAEGNFIWEAGSDRCTDAHGAELLEEAAKEIANEKRGQGKDYKGFGKQGGKAFAEKISKGKLPKGDAAVFWFDKGFTNAQAIERINAVPGYAREWSEGALYRQLGKRNAFAGRRAKEK